MVYRIPPLNEIENFTKVGIKNNDDKFMSSTTNVTLLTIGIGLVSLGANSIAANLLVGAIEIVLGIGVLAFYEFTPTK